MDTIPKPAKVEGFTGPFSAGLEPVTSLYQSKTFRLNLMLMNHFRELLPRPDGGVWEDVRTSDDYVWPFGVQFQFYNRHVLVLLPAVLKERDQSRETYSGRDVLLYYQGRTLTERQLARVMRRVAVVFEDAYEDLYGPIR